MTSNSSAEPGTDAEVADHSEAESQADINLALPVSFEAKYGKGADRTLVLGGGGVFFVAWQAAYLNGLANRGVDVAHAEIIVGTSAGSVIAAILAGGHLKRFGKTVDVLSRFPSLVGMLAPAADFQPSQLRALDLFREAVEASPPTVQTIGHAALAADTPSSSETRRSVALAVASRGWPSKSLKITSTDAYSGERLVITHEAGVSAVRAAAASSAVPGIFAPQPVLDRRGMDGGVSGSGTHCDLVAGAKRTLVISLSAAIKERVATMTIPADQFDVEITNLRASGTATLTRGPNKVDITQLMSPAAIPDAIAMGDEQAATDATELAAFWN